MPEIQYLPDKEYKKLGFRCGLEVHQQLDTKTKLFCNCPVGLTNREPDMRILRHMRPTLSELGEYDRTALMEFRTRKQVVYELFSDRTCTYEMDDTPPFPLNRDALKIAIEIALLLNCKLVDEVHVTRKQYLDGSIPTGFQRTAMIGVDGWVPFKDRKIRIAALTLEEDACREMSDVGHTITWKTDRLSTPLIEVITQPDIVNPEEVPEVNRLIGELLRSTGKVRRGIGTVRQDVNVSITGGTRVEIKGVPQIGWHRALTHNEAMRQKALLEISSEMQKRGITEENLVIDSVDISDYAAKTHSAHLQNAVKEGGKVVAVSFSNCKDIFNKEVLPGRTFADEVSGRIRVVACIDSFPNILHSDEPGITGLLNSEWEHIKGSMNAEEKDLKVILFGDKQDVDTAVAEVTDRMKEALSGVPTETRQPFSDGNTDFERILPGPDRMYPDTDTPPTRVEKSLVEEIESQLPERPWDKLKRYMDAGLNEEVARKIARSRYSKLFDELISKVKLSAPRIAHLLLRVRSDLSVYDPISNLDIESWVELFNLYGNGSVSSDGLINLFDAFLETGETKEELVDTLSLQLLDQDDVKKILDDLTKSLTFDDTMKENTRRNYVYLKLRERVGPRYDGKQVRSLVDAIIS